MDLSLESGFALTKAGVISAGEDGICRSSSRERSAGGGGGAGVAFLPKVTFFCELSWAFLKVVNLEGCIPPEVGSSVSQLLISEVDLVGAAMGAWSGLK